MSDEKFPLQVTGLIPPGKGIGTGKVNPDRNVFFPETLNGTSVTHRLVPVSKIVVAVVAVGENLTMAFGTFRLKGVPPAVV